MYKKILIFTLIMCLSLSYAAGAFELITAEPETVIEDSVNIQDDISYIENLALGYKDKYVVEKLQSANISAIDEFYRELSKPVEVKELDEGNTKLDLSVITDESLRKEFKALKLFAGYGGITASFEPVCYYQIYRDIILVGGYTNYDISIPRYDDAYYAWVCAVENITREVVPNDTHLKMLDGFKNLYDFIEKDKGEFKMFLLKESKLNSVWERNDK